MKDTLLEVMPYIVSVTAALISGLTSYSIARKQTRSDIEKLEKQHQLDIDKARERFSMEKEKMELEHKNQLELQQKNFENEFGGNLVNTMLAEAMKMPEVRNQFTKGFNKSRKNNTKN